MNNEQLINKIYDDCARHGFSGLCKALRPILADSGYMADLAEILRAACAPVPMTLDEAMVEQFSRTSGGEAIAAAAAMRAIERFFYEDATNREGEDRIRYAREAAAAEQHACENNWHYQWDLDECPSSKCADLGDDHQHYTCQLWNGTEILQSLTDICDPDQTYRRIVEAELAMEAMTAAR